MANCWLTVPSYACARYRDINRLDFGLASTYNIGPTLVYGDCCAIAFEYISPESAPPPPSSGAFEDAFESGNFNAQRAL